MHILSIDSSPPHPTIPVMSYPFSVCCTVLLRTRREMSRRNFSANLLWLSHQGSCSFPRPHSTVQSFLFMDNGCRRSEGDSASLNAICNYILPTLVPIIFPLNKNGSNRNLYYRADGRGHWETGEKGRLPVTWSERVEGWELACSFFSLARSMIYCY